MPHGAVIIGSQEELEILFLGFHQRFARALAAEGVKTMILSCAAGIDPDTMEDIIHTLAPDELPLAVKNSNSEQIFGFDMPVIDKAAGRIKDSSYSMAKEAERQRMEAPTLPRTSAQSPLATNKWLNYGFAPVDDL